jgi:hypothetical protein
LRERFIENKRPLNPTHIFPKKEEQIEIRTTKKIIIMPQSSNDEEKKTL